MIQYICNSCNSEGNFKCFTKYNEWINSKETSEEIKNELKAINNDKEK